MFYSALPYVQQMSNRKTIWTYALVVAECDGDTDEGARTTGGETGKGLEVRRGERRTTG